MKDMEMMKDMKEMKGMKKSSPWIMHVKAQAKKLGLKYGEALKDKRTKASYKK